MLFSFLFVCVDSNADTLHADRAIRRYDFLDVAPPQAKGTSCVTKGLKLRPKQFRRLTLRVAQTKFVRRTTGKGAVDGVFGHAKAFGGVSGRSDRLRP